MRRSTYLRPAVAALALIAGLLTPSAASAAQTTVTGDLAGTVRSVSGVSLSVGVTHASNSLRLLTSRWVKVSADAKTTIKRDGKKVKVKALRAGDAITAYVRCTFTMTNSSTKVACIAVRINASKSNAPVPVQLVVSGFVSSLQASGFSMTSTQFDADEKATALIDALRALQPLPVLVDSATSVLFGGAPSKFSALTAPSKVRVAVTCMSAVPYNCRATKLEIILPSAEPVTMVGIITGVTATTLTMDVESVVHRGDATINVQVLKQKQMPVSIPLGTPVTIAGAAGTLASLVIGVRYTVNAQCRFSVPYGCTAEAIKD